MWQMPEYSRQGSDGLCHHLLSSDEEGASAYIVIDMVCQVVVGGIQ